MPTNNKRPLIGVTGPAKRIKVGWWATRLTLLLCGSRSVYLTPRTPPGKYELQGVIIGGGDDIDPAHYGQDGDAGAVYDAERDEFEIRIIRQCIDKTIPILGICRGAQLINVVLGGTLYLDIRCMRKNTPNYNSAFSVKWVTIKDASSLASYVGSRLLKVNSLHHQAVDKLGKGLLKVAEDKDGFVQGIETDRNFVIGVQWHPEYLFYLKPHRRLFSALKAVAERGDKKSIDI